jgi:hypothetical protein
MDKFLDTVNRDSGNDKVSGILDSETLFKDEI